MEFIMKICLIYLFFIIVFFSGDDFEYNWNGNRKNVIVNISNRENFLK